MNTAVDGSSPGLALLGIAPSQWIADGTPPQFEELLQTRPLSSSPGASVSEHALGRWFSDLANRSNDLKADLTAPGLVAAEMGLIPSINRMNELQIRQMVLSMQGTVAHGVINHVKTGLNTLVKGA